MKKKIILAISGLLILAITVTVQAVNNYKLIKKQEATFLSCCEAASYYLDEYESTGNELQYTYAVSEIYSASMLALVISEHDDGMTVIHNELNACYGNLTASQKESKEYIERLYNALKHYTTNKSIGAFEAELMSFNNAVNASIAD